MTEGAGEGQVNPDIILKIDLNTSMLVADLGEALSRFRTIT